MIVDLEKILYAVLGGVSMMIVTKAGAAFRSRVTGRDRLARYSTFIRRHARNRREIENLLFEGRNIRSIVMQGVDAAYVALAGETPSVAVLYLRNVDDARLFRACLDHLDDPAVMYALAARRRTPDGDAEACEECRELTDDADRNLETTWFRLSHGRDASDQNVDEAMLEQAVSLAKTRDRDVSQSGACHISVRIAAEDGRGDILVLPTSTAFRRAFTGECATDDLSRFPARDLFGKILKVRKKMSED